MSAPIPAISLWQPWASLMAWEVKWLETRSWPAPKALIGQRFAIASTASLPPAARDVLRPRAGVGPQPPIFEAVQAHGGRVSWSRTRLRHELPLGAVLCTARLVGCWYMHHPEALNDNLVGIVPLDGMMLYRRPGDAIGQDITDQLPFGVFDSGRWGWEFDDVVPFTRPVPAKGGQRVWRWSPPAAA